MTDYLIMAAGWTWMIYDVWGMIYDAWRLFS